MILDAATKLFFDEGANAVSAMRICEETGVARTTIYRQWPDQPSLLLATIEAMIAPDVEAPNSGDLEADLTTALTGLRGRMSERPVRQVIAALIEHGLRDKGFLRAQRRFVEGLVAHVSAALTYATERGELPDDFDCASAASIIAGPLLYQHLLVSQKISTEMIEQIVSQFIQTVATGIE